MIPHYQDEHVTLHHGDCLDVLATLPDDSVDAVVTDPPYAFPGGFMGKSWDTYDGREDAGFAYWLSGLIDGEGHFAIKAHTRGTYAPCLQLGMRRDERGTLELIKRTLNIGQIVDLDHEPNPMSRWLVQDKAGCQRLVDLLDKYPLRAKKRMDYMAWREAVCEWSNRPRGNRWHGAADNARMAELRQRLMSGRAYVEPPWSGNEFQDWCRLWVRECLRVLKPGGHLLSFGGTRTWHRMAVAVEDAGFELRDSIAWLYGSGFPKSLDVSKAIDKAAGAERDVVGSKVTRIPGGTTYAQDEWTKNARELGEVDITAPATPTAEQWQGWGTALKPAFEPIVVARKPLSGTVAKNVQEWGTGALNIDATRVAGENPSIARRQGATNHLSTRPAAAAEAEGKIESRTSPERFREERPGEQLGRWPTNVVLDDTAAQAVDEDSGVLTTGGGKRNSAKASGTYGAFAGDEPERTFDANSGGASRFFPVFKYQAKADADDRPRDDNTSHPTCKPVELMRWLCRLVCPPHGTVLDPFAGSGTTLQAARAEGFACIGIEAEADYLPLIKQRLARVGSPVNTGRWPGHTDQPGQVSMFDLLGGDAA